MLARMGRKRTLYILLVGIWASGATVELSMAAPHKNKQWCSELKTEYESALLLLSGCPKHLNR